MEQATAQRIAELRSASLVRELSTDEMREAIKLMREDRVRAATTSTKARAAKGKIDFNPDDLLSGLGSMDGIADEGIGGPARLANEQPKTIAHTERQAQAGQLLGRKL